MIGQMNQAEIPVGEPTPLTLPEALARAQELIELRTKEGLSEARDLCRRILEVAPSSGPALYLLGVVEFYCKEFAAAQAPLQLAIDADPAVAAPHYFLGCALFELQRHAQAEAALREAVRLNPRQPEFLVDLSRVLIARGGFAEALSRCDAAISLAPGMAQAHLLRAGALRGLGRLNEAIAACGQAIELDPRDPGARHSLAAIQLELGLVEEAERTLRIAIEIQPGFEAGHSGLAHCLGLQGRTPEAITALEGLAEVNPSYPDLPDRLELARLTTSIQERAARVAQNIKPLFVLAPVARCGTTFLQRLINTSRQMVMFGENEDITRRLPAAIEFACSKAGMKEDLSAFGDLGRMIADEWTAGLFPGRGDGYLELSLRNFYDAVRHYQATADRLGRAWGIKEPYAGQLGMLRTLLPQARFICIYRDLFDVARSYKARGWFRSPYDVVKLAHDWQDGMRSMLSAGNTRVCIVRYEDLVANADHALARIEEFASLSGIDRKLMGVKVNTSAHDSRGRWISAYMAPEELSKEEHLALVAHARGMLQHLGYDT